jgi:hypothetical protein
VDDVAAGTRRIYRLNPVALAALRDQLGTYWQRALAGYADAAEAPGKKGWMTQTDTATVRKQVVVDAPLRQTGPKARARYEWSRAQRSRLDYKSARFGSVPRPCPEGTEHPVQRASAAAIRDPRYRAERRLLARGREESGCSP